MNLKAVAALVGGELQGDPEYLVAGAAGLAEAGPQDVTYLAEAKFESLLADSKAGAVLLEPARKVAVDTTSAKKAAYTFNVIYVAEPKRAFNKYLQQLAAFMTPKLPLGYHPTAVISPYARLGRDVHVGAHAVIEAGAVIGDKARIYANCYVGHDAKVGAGSTLYPNVVVRERCVLGERVILHPGVVIGADGFGFLQTPAGHEKVPQLGTVEIGDDVEIGANSCVDRATTGKTVVARGTKVDNLVQIAHNVRIGEHCVLVAQCGVAGSAELGAWTMLSGQVAIAPQLKIGSKVQVAGQSGVMADLPDGAVVFGTPSLPFRESFKLQALLKRLPEMWEFIKKAKKAEADQAPAPQEDRQSA